MQENTKRANHFSTSKQDNLILGIKGYELTEDIPPLIPYYLFLFLVDKT